MRASVGIAYGRQAKSLLVRLSAVLMAGLLISATPSMSLAASAASRVALVVGVSRYEKAPALDNPAKDAKLVETTLAKLGFRVRVVMDPSRVKLIEALSAFEGDASSAEAAIIYFAGHGALIDGANYLLPVDASSATRSLLTGTAVESSRLSQALLGASTVRLVILDACRDNPTATRSVGARGGLAREASRVSTQVVTLMAAGPGEVALDGDGANSPFALALARGISRPGMTVGALPGYVQTEVERMTDSQQVPDLQGIWTDVNWTFQADSETAASKPSSAAGWERDRLFWLSIKDSNDPADFQAYIEAQDNGEVAGAFRKLAINRLQDLKRSTTKSTVAPAPSQDLLLSARDAFARGDHSAAIRDWTAAAREGNGAAMYNLGVMAASGRPPPVDERAAARWFKASAEAGHPGGMVNFGVSQLNGFGTPKNESGGVKWLRAAAEAGSPTALGMVGEAYLRGMGVRRDPAEAARWMQRAIDAGDGPAIAQLAELYEKGEGVPKSLTRAFSLYQRAASSGDSQAMVRMGYFYEDGDVVPRDEVQAATWYQRAAETGDSEGMSSLAVMLENGSGLQRDEGRAAHYYRAAADLGDARGYLGLGSLTARGAGVVQNSSEALRLFTIAADLGSPTAMRNVAIMYETGSGTQRNLNRAIAFYRKAAAAGDDVSAEELRRLALH